MQNVRAILFDAVGTLIRPRGSVAAAYGAVGRRHGFELSESELRQRFARAFAHQESVDAGANNWRTNEIREKQRWRHIVRDVFSASGAGETIDKLFLDLWDYFAALENWSLYPDVPAAWTAVQSQGLTTGVASNMDRRLRKIGAGLTPLDQCRHWFVSSEIGYRKPSEKFFAAVSTQLELEPSQLLFVGDDPVLDFQAAKSCGWHSVLLQRDSGSFTSDSIRSLDELVALLAT